MDTDTMIDSLQNMMKDDPLLRSEQNRLQRLRIHIEKAALIRSFIEATEGNFYAVAELSENAKIDWTFSLDMHRVFYTIELDWNQQTEARRAFGGVFPECVERRVITGGERVARTYTWPIENEDGKAGIVIRFWRKAVDREKIDGCVVRVEKYTPPRFMTRPMMEYETKATIYCPTKEI